MQNDDSQFHQDDADRRLWQRFRQASGGCGEGHEPAQQDPPDPNDLAAYLDGTADPALIDAIERQMAVDPQLLEAVIELRAIRDATGQGHDSAVPANVISTAKGLVQQTPASSRDETPTVLYRIGWRLQWAAAAVFVLTAGWGGYSTGLNAYTTDTPGDMDTPAMIFGLEEDLDESSIELVDETTGDPL